MSIRIERMNAENFNCRSLDSFVRHQEVKNCWRLVDGEKRLMPVCFTEEWELPKLRQEAQELIELHAKGRPVFLALSGESVVGFAALGRRLGSALQYLQLLSFHVTAGERGKGVGRRLFQAVCEAAAEEGAEKLYISAHSSEESQAAYRALRCVDALEPDAELAEEEPCDIQMEYDLRNEITVRLGEATDLPGWMELVREVAWNFPGLETEEALAEHEATVARFISKRTAVCALVDGRIAGVLLFSRRLNMLCCMAVAPAYRRRGLARRMLALMDTLADPTRDVTVTTFREGDPKGDAPRAVYMRLGFIPKELVMENDYPCQRFVRSAEHAKR